MGSNQWGQAFSLYFTCFAVSASTRRRNWLPVRTYAIQPSRHAPRVRPMHVIPSRQRKLPLMHRLASPARHSLCSKRTFHTIPRNVFPETCPRIDREPGRIGTDTSPPEIRRPPRIVPRAKLEPAARPFARRPVVLPTARGPGAMPATCRPTTAELPACGLIRFIVDNAEKYFQVPSAYSIVNPPDTNCSHRTPSIHWHAPHLQNPR